MVRSRRIVAPALLLLAPAVASCGGVGFDPAEAVKTLRVLAVQKTPPYQAPGGEVRLRLLYWDGKVQDDAPRDLSILFADCVNPAADLYYGCFEASRLASAEVIEKPATGEPPASDADHVAVHKFIVPEDIVSSRPPPPPGIPAYGLGYVLFGVCAGTLQETTSTGNGALPIACVGPDGARRGVEDFDPGYTSIYAYADGRANANPVVIAAALRSGGVALAPNDNGVVHVTRCAGNPCPELEFKLDIDRASAEPDPGATDLDGRPVSEQLWINYYKTGGKLTKGLRLVNDATRGWNDDNATGWTAPPTPGMVRLWGIVRDNRGGVEWIELKVSVD